MNDSMLASKAIGEAQSSSTLFDIFLLLLTNYFFNKEFQYLLDHFRYVRHYRGHMGNNTSFPAEFFVKGCAKTVHIYVSCGIFV